MSFAGDWYGAYCGDWFGPAMTSVVVIPASSPMAWGGYFPPAMQRQIKNPGEAEAIAVILSFMGAVNEQII